MTTPSNVTMQDINVELGRSPTQSWYMHSLNDDDPRLLAKVPSSGQWYLSSAANRTASAKTLLVGGNSFVHGYLAANFGSFSPNYTTPRGGTIDTFVSRDSTNLGGRTTLSVSNIPSYPGQFDVFSRIRIRTGSFLGPVIRELFPGDASFVRGGSTSQWSWYADQGVNDWMLPYNGQNLFFTMFEP